MRKLALLIALCVAISMTVSCRKVETVDTPTSAKPSVKKIKSVEQAPIKMFQPTQVVTPPPPVEAAAPPQTGPEGAPGEPLAPPNEEIKKPLPSEAGN